MKRKNALFEKQWFFFSELYLIEEVVMKMKVAAFCIHSPQTPSLDVMVDVH